MSNSDALLYEDTTGIQENLVVNDFRTGIHYTDTKQNIPKMALHEFNLSLSVYYYKPQMSQMFYSQNKSRRERSEMFAVPISVDLGVM